MEEVLKDEIKHAQKRIKVIKNPIYLDETSVL